MTDQGNKQALPPGFRLGSYRVVRVPGFGITYLCDHAGLGVQVAVKEYRATPGEPPAEAPRRTGELARGQADPQESLAAAGVAGYSPSVLEAVDWGLRLVETERPKLWTTGCCGCTRRPRRGTDGLRSKDMHQLRPA